MPPRFTVLPDDRLSAVQSLIDERLEQTADLISAASFNGFIDPIMRRVLVDGFQRAGADEGTVWLLEEAAGNLAAAFNSGPNAEAIVGRFRLSAGTGVISLVLASEQPICEHELYRNQRQDTALDSQFGVLTCSMIAVPFYFGSKLRGVISCVRLKDAGSPGPDPPRLPLESMAAMELAASVLTRLIDHRLLSMTLGRSNP